MAGQLHHVLPQITANYALGPPSLQGKSFSEGRTSERDGSLDATAQPWAKAA